MDGDYQDAATFAALRKELEDSIVRRTIWRFRRSLFETVVEQLAKSDCARGARVIVEKPFGHDLASAKELNEISARDFDESDIFRIDHYLGKRPVNNMLAFRFANASWNRSGTATTSRACRSPWPRTSACRAAGGFYDQTGTIRDVVQNHLFQVLSNLAMEPPVRTDSESVRDEKVKVLKAISPIEEKDLVRGQFRGYRTKTACARTRRSKPSRR